MTIMTCVRVGGGGCQGDGEGMVSSFEIITIVCDMGGGGQSND